MVDPRGSVPVAQDSEAYDVPVGVVRQDSRHEDWQTLEISSSDGANVVVTAGTQARAQTREAWARHLNGR